MRQPRTITENRKTSKPTPPLTNAFPSIRKIDKLPIHLVGSAIASPNVFLVDSFLVSKRSFYTYGKTD
jgi:hypothetical protein